MEGYQLKLPLNLETIIPVDDSVRLLRQFVEAMALTDLYSAYERINTVLRRTLLKICHNELLLQHTFIVQCLCVFLISYFGLCYLYSSTTIPKGMAV